MYKQYNLPIPQLDFRHEGSKTEIISFVGKRQTAFLPMVELFKPVKNQTTNRFSCFTKTLHQI